ncbi:haloacid dehalogenase type II [Pseudomonas sp. C1C7]|uniref:haloacid dehalogenase type II n=1 Tax=Pseudomonas sp. C1C7 TaxID=2735272 RepID=UPI00158614FD|nr:haloacid dehalogenase type II [Pseudomonas sp. C1C7]NUT77097.1 haloacid dehalogenase type II [Pseudomonas sp. C1C7]
MSTLDEVGFLGFDVFGTVVDWRTSVARESARYLQRLGMQIDPLAFADQWRSLYQPSMQRVRSGERAFVTLDVLNRENLQTLMARHGVETGRLEEADFAAWNTAWQKLDPWPDSVEGLTRLKRRFAIGPISNGHIAGMMNLARYGGLPWDVITGAELARAYKPQPEVYFRSAEAVGLPPNRVAMVAAHNSDLVAARACGFRTVFVTRPVEHGPGQTIDLQPEQEWDVVAESMTELAALLDC